MKTPPPSLGSALWLPCALALACSGAPPPPPIVPLAPTVVAPEPDPDGDGLAGSSDRCPDAPEDCDGRDDADGCPDPDDDQDGVADVCDACPEERGTAPDGCAHLVIVEQAQIRILRGAWFARNSVALTPTSRPQLDEVAQVLVDQPRIRRVAVEGHATRDERDPGRLSARRAEAVRDYLVARGVDAARLEAQALADTRPVAAPNETRAAERNRRVEFRVLDVEQPPPRTSRPRVAVPAGCPDHPPPVRGPCRPPAPPVG